MLGQVHALHLLLSLQQSKDSKLEPKKDIYNKLYDLVFVLYIYIYITKQINSVRTKQAPAITLPEGYCLKYAQYA